MDWHEYGYVTEEYRDAILDKISFSDILDKYNLDYYNSPSGEFSIKMRCPLPEHNFGGERTASMFVNESDNSFYCFGCNSGGTVIEFVSRYTKIDIITTLKNMSRDLKIDDSCIACISTDGEKTSAEMVNTYVFTSGVIIREYLASQIKLDSYDKKCRWADVQFKKLDSLLEEGDDSWEKAKKYSEKLRDHLGGKY